MDVHEQLAFGFGHAVQVEIIYDRKRIKGRDN